VLLQIVFNIFLYVDAPSSIERIIRLLRAMDEPDLPDFSWGSFNC
jgi:hypothetical protein